MEHDGQTSLEVETTDDIARLCKEMAGAYWSFKFGFVSQKGPAVRLFLVFSIG